MKVLLMLVFILGLVGCSSQQLDKLKETTKAKLSQTTPPAIAKVLECEAVDVIQADVDDILNKIFKQEEEVVSLTSDGNILYQQLCKSFTGVTVDLLLEQGVPVTWKCKTTNASEAVKKLTNFGCDLI